MGQISLAEVSQFISQCLSQDFPKMVNHILLYTKDEKVIYNIKDYNDITDDSSGYRSLPKEFLMNNEIAGIFANRDSGVINFTNSYETIIRIEVATIICQILPCQR